MDDKPLTIVYGPPPKNIMTLNADDEEDLGPRQREKDASKLSSSRRKGGRSKK